MSPLLLTTGTTGDAHSANSTFSIMPCFSNLSKDSLYLSRMEYGTGLAFLKMGLTSFMCNCTFKPSILPTSLLSNKSMYLSKTLS